MGGENPDSRMEFRAINHIGDERVAFDLLHFLSHVDGAVFDDTVTARVDVHQGQLLKRALNPRIFELLNGARGRGEKPFSIYTRRLLLTFRSRVGETEKRELGKLWGPLFGR